jgi:hypothetical protein
MRGVMAVRSGAWRLNAACVWVAAELAKIGAA